MDRLITGPEVHCRVSVGLVPVDFDVLIRLVLGQKCTVAFKLD